ncbi:aminoglycoside phosphotransferase [Kribbella sp. ALI-6-A]|uniref:phosphotransferase enzyme family protein n=1 Tax=Kribbella sp. ALI-6-A TaxID=1933817 RepID=UPI00097BD892|nr:phosphotransferase [Kribbella sp. ALI-6-A]ONI68500.1 aminoglycoside phosphotransferase [Kribbella sp. ALI-6-A]
MVRIERSLPRPDDLRDHLAEAYRLPFTGCTLLRSLVNDVYRLTTATGDYVIKLYAVRPLPEIRWEAELSIHLSQHQVATPPLIPLGDGASAGVLAMPEGDRPYLLTAFVDGSKPQAPFTDDLYRSFGELVAQFHTATDTFAPALDRRAADLSHSLDEPAAEIVPLLPAADGELVAALASAVRDKVADGLSRGVCHGDVSLDNVLITPDGLSLHDFDLSAEGYRAADFTGVAATPHWDAFRAGYERHRPIAPADLAAIDWLTVAGRISNLHFHLVRKPLFRGTESRAEGWAAGELAELRAAAGRLL